MCSVVIGKVVDWMAANSMAVAPSKLYTGSKHILVLYFIIDP